MSIYDERQSRQALIVWMYSNKKVKQLQKYGFVYYVSRKMKSPRQAMATDYATAFDAYAADLMAKKDSDDKDRLNERYA